MYVLLLFLVVYQHIVVTLDTGNVSRKTRNSSHVSTEILRYCVLRQLQSGTKTP